MGLYIEERILILYPIHIVALYSSTESFKTWEFGDAFAPDDLLSEEDPCETLIGLEANYYIVNDGVTDGFVSLDLGSAAVVSQIQLKNVKNREYNE